MTTRKAGISGCPRYPQIVIPSAAEKSKTAFGDPRTLHMTSPAILLRPCPRHYRSFQHIKTRFQEVVPVLSFVMRQAARTR